MTTRIRVSDMTYHTHEEIVQTAIEMADGVDSVDIDSEEQVATVEGDVSPDEVLEKVAMAGYEAETVE
ncbi:heavy-metal-associated domain-containing protein [Haloarchaeobius sp. HME9146]|uniref:heavy-metal-associated domain-containing protein n=1 Tax=Haloarchaeobius sp. HME9146 TaxID=2978732 RepID=UPI0021C0A92D|nr:heavy metal-associated domain-containing protein [Haloarchaeobius sp. HME9146]MCT9096563.1 heavy-metal-associated domain-containing protein [Haloarchaeobius sp. HME9146]